MMDEDVRVSDGMLDLTETAGACFEALHAMLENQPDGYVVVSFPLMGGEVGELVVYRPDELLPLAS